MTQIISPASEITLVSETLTWPFMSSLATQDYDEKSAALVYQTARAKKMLAQEKPLTPVQVDQIQLYWNQAWPIIAFDADADPQTIPETPFWLFVDAKEPIDVVSNELSFNLWLREFYIDGKFFLSPKLKRDKKVENTFVVNLYPVVASSFHDNYDKVKGHIIPYTLIDQLPVGLTFDDPLVDQVIHGNKAEVVPDPVTP